MQLVTKKPSLYIEGYGLVINIVSTEYSFMLNFYNTISSRSIAKVMIFTLGIDGDGNSVINTELDMLAMPFWTNFLLYNIPGQGQTI